MGPFSFADAADDALDDVDGIVRLVDPMRSNKSGCQKDEMSRVDASPRQKVWGGGAGRTLLDG